MDKVYLQQEGRRRFAFLLATLTIFFFSYLAYCYFQPPKIVLRIYDWQTGKLYVEAPAQVGDRLFFGWVHSLEKIPWHEYYQIDENLDLVLDTITFPAFGAGIPENKGRVCYVKDGLIYMEQIEQKFPELVWLNSHFATQDILLEESFVTKGSMLPEHTRVRLVIERVNAYGWK